MRKYPPHLGAMLLGALAGLTAAALLSQLEGGLPYPVPMVLSFVIVLSAIAGADSIAERAQRHASSKAAERE